MSWRILVFYPEPEVIDQPMLKLKTHVPVHVTDFPVVNEHVDELSSARIWQNKLCATLSANVNINYRLPIKVYYRICTKRKKDIMLELVIIQRFSS
jgi:hypothetical protein